MMEEKVLGMTRRDGFWREIGLFHGKVSSFRITRRNKKMGTDSFRLRNIVVGR